MTRRGDSSRLRAILDDTLVLGAVALVIGAAALLISYRAQNGLPWMGTYEVAVEVPDAAKLLKNADVRIGGARVGQVLAIEPQPGGDDHPPFTRLELQLKPDTGPLPADTTAEVRLASVLGGKFLDLVPGDSRETIPEGGTLELEQGKAGADADEALLIFDPETRTAIRALLAELAGGMAGQGESVNATLDVAARALPAAQRVLGVLVAPDTDLAGFVDGVTDAATALEPLAGDLGILIDDSATTLAAIDAAGASFDQALAVSPATLGATADALRAARPVLDDAEAVVTALEPAGEILEDSLAEVVATMLASEPVTRRMAGLAPAMNDALVAVDEFSSEPAALGAITALKGEDLATFGGSAFIGLGAILREAADAQLHCNTTALWARNLASVASEGDSGGNWLRMIPVMEPSELFHAAEQAENLHVNPYPNQNAQECEAGNEGYLPGRQIGNPPGLQPTDHEVTTQAEGR